MDELKSNNRVEETLDAIRALLSRSVALQEDTLNLEKQSGETSANLLQHAGTDTAMAQQRTGLAQERTSLVRAQTRLSTRSTELSEIRTDLARERRNLAIERTDYAGLRTELARSRTSLSQQRVHMAEVRTRLAEKRTMLAITRTVYSKMRTELAKGRTYLALIRTGLAFTTMAIFLFRQFGISWWTVFDAGMGVASVAATIIGLIGYTKSAHLTKRLGLRAAEDEVGQLM